MFSFVNNLKKRHIQDCDGQRHPKCSRIERIEDVRKRPRHDSDEQQLPKRSRIDSSEYFVLTPSSRKVDFTGWINQLKQEEEEQNAALRIRTRVELTLDVLRDQRCCNGDIRLSKIWKMLDSVPKYPRSEHQKEFHEWFVFANLPHIYGDDWEANATRVLESFGLTKIQYEVLVSTPRRWGKTISIAMFCAVVLLCVPSFWASVFSPGKRASSSLMGEVIRMIYRLGCANRIVKKTQEELFVSTVAVESSFGQSARSLAEDPDTARMYSFPASITG